MKTTDYDEFGLKDNYQFKECRIFLSPLRSRQGIHNKLFFVVLPSVEELEKAGLLYGYHFIVHEHIDLRLAPKVPWTKSLVKEFESILKSEGIGDLLIDWPGLDPDLYGGPVGVRMCYNALEMNSRLILAHLSTTIKNTREPIKAKRERERLVRENLLVNQFHHYMVHQSGFGTEEISLVLFSSWIRLKEIARNGSKAEAIRTGWTAVRRVFLRRKRKG